MRRRSPLSLVVLLAAVLLAACGSGGNATRADRPSGMPMDGMDDHMGGEHGEASPVADDAREIAVTADGFGFDPDEITVAADEDIAIVLTAVDALHDFTIDELDTHVVAGRDETATGGLRANEPGRYTFYCAVAGHRDAGMEGTLVVQG